MKTLSFFFCLSFTISSFCQVTDKPVSWYKCMKGTIGKYPITMHLHKWKKNYAGYYYYDRSQQPIEISGEDSANSKVGLSAFLRGPEGENNLSETFIGKWDGNSLTGTWYASGKSAPLRFSLAPSKDSTVPDFTFVYTEGSIKLRPKMNKSPEATFFASSIWPTNQIRSSDFIKKQIIDISGGKSDVEIGKLLIDQKKIFFDEYKSDFKDATDKEISEYGLSYNYELQSNVSVVFSSSKLISFSSDGYTYTGGAHGNFGTTFLVLDLANKKKLTLGDVLHLEDSVTLNIVLEDKLRKAYKLKSTDMLTEILFDEKISFNDNFFVTEKGIGFNYNPYEIAAYVYGEIRLFIPFSEIKSLLKQEFLSLIE